MKPIYLDYNATTPIHPEVAEAMLPFLREGFGNPSSSHTFGVFTRKAIEKARAQVAGMLKCNLDEVVFTSGGSEANNLAIKGFVQANSQRGNHIITSQIEHPAVLEVCGYLESQGYRVTYLPVDSDGLLSVEEVREAIKPETILISIMQANNEVGTLQPLAEIVALAHERGIVVHTDSAQAVGKVAVDIPTLGADMLSIAGHKFYAPKGVGALYRRRGTVLEKQLHGADHEQNLRAGTENVLELVGLGQACELVTRRQAEFAEHARLLRDRLESKLIAELPSAVVNGHPEKRLPNTLSISFPGIVADTILSELTDVACSAGAACHSDQVHMSHVLEAMKVPEEQAMGTLRLSVGYATTEAEIDAAAERIVATVRGLQTGTAGSATVKSESDQVRLTRYTHGLGCACKLRPQALERILQEVPVRDDHNVLVGTSTADDAAVYRLSDKLAIVESVDFFTPIVDDPYQFGAIAAANSLSDIYAMGAKPLFALSVVGFPSNRLPESVLTQILKGAADKAAEAGISIIGGHTIDDTEPKYGLAVTGTVHPDKVLTNAGPRIGDKLILSKPLGTGIITTAAKRGLAEAEVIEQAIMVMVTLNRSAAEAMANYDVSACTDVTGFGLLGHLKEMTTGGSVRATILAGTVPLIPGVAELVQAGAIPGGTENNREFVSDKVSWSDSISPTMQLLLCDAQTSGGLLIAVKPEQADKLLEDLHQCGLAAAAIIGEISAAGHGEIEVS
jgi:cysteine desulfurase NifS/selenium donor protein